MFPFRSQFDRHLRSLIEILHINDIFNSRVPDDLIRFVGVGAFESKHNAFLKVVFLIGFDDGIYQQVAPEDASEDINKDGLDLRGIVQQS